MKLNGIKCTNYTAGELFSAVLYETDTEAIKAIDPERLVVQSDDGTAIEEFTAYGRLFSVKHNLVDETYVVEFSRVTGTEKKLSEIEEFGKQLGQRINDSKAKLLGVSARATKERIAITEVTIEVDSLDGLNKIIRELRKVDSVYEVNRKN